MLGGLEKILDINFSPDVDISILNFTKVDGGKRFQKDGETLHLNLEALEPEQRREVLTLPQDQFEEQGRVLREDEEEEVAAIESGYNDDMDDILDYFDGVLSERYHAILDTSLYLRSLIEQRDLHKDEIQEKKRDIAKRHGMDAFYLSSLTTAGYFDPDGGLRDLYVDMGLNEQYSKYNFQQELESLVELKLLCVFVESDDDISDATKKTRGRLAKYQKEDPINDWIDIRGIGGSCKEIIDGVVENLEDEFIGIDYDRWQDGADYTVRIYPRSLPNIS